MGSHIQTPKQNVLKEGIPEGRNTSHLKEKKRKKAILAPNKDAI